MKKIILTILLCFILIPLWADSLDNKNISYKYKIAQSKYPWLTLYIYKTIEYYCNYWEDIYTLDKYLILSVIHEESGRYCNNNLEKMIEVVSISGARGMMQIMPIHSLDDPDKLFDYDYNIKKGIWYYAKCMKKAKGNIEEASRMYNAGLYNKRSRYKNWKYVKRICKNYKDFYKEINLYYERKFIFR